MVSVTGRRGMNQYVSSGSEKTMALRPLDDGPEDLAAACLAVFRLPSSVFFPSCAVKRAVDGQDMVQSHR
jgi:hypothetical protein